MRDDKPASDLQAIKANAERDLAPRTLPNGKLYCFELSRTEGEQDDCTGDLEDALFKAENDKKLGLRNILRAIDRLMLQRNPCNWFQRTMRLDKCRVE